MAITKIKSSNIEDDAVTTAKIAPNTIIPADLANNSVDSAAIVAGAVDDAHLATGISASKLTGALPAISGASLTGVSTDTTRLEYNQAILAFKLAAQNSLARFQMVDQVIDEYQDATGIDAGNSTNELAGGSGTAKYYNGGSSVTPTTSSVGSVASTGTVDGDYTYYKWTTVASNHTFTTDTAQDYEYLVIAGGGGGGGINYAGGGGAGGYRTATGFAVAATTITGITVGAAGTAGASGQTGGTGGNSVFSTITSAGGGGGGMSSQVAGNGGSGGGAGRGGSLVGGSGNTPSTSPSQGNDGGDAGTGTGGAGGGGAGGVGADATSGSGGNGGVGLSSSIDGTPTFRGGGGGGAEHWNSGTAGTGGNGGGGNGGSNTAAMTAGIATTGGGGGGSNATEFASGGPTGAPGGSGIVIIRRLTSAESGGADLTLQSNATIAESAPTTANLVVLIEDSGSGTADLAADIKAKVSRASTADFTGYVTFTDEGNWGTDKRILRSNDIDLTSTNTGTSMRYKIETFNQSAGSKETRIHATSLAWA